MSTSRSQKEEKRMPEPEARLLSSIIQFSADAILGWGRDFTITNWNHSAELLYGYSSEEIIGQPASLLEPPGRAGETVGVTARVKNEHFVRGDTSRATKDGRVIDVAATSSQIIDESGDFVGVSSIHRDISGRKRLQKRLSESEEKFRGIADRSFDAILMLDTEGVVNYVSPAIMKILGYDQTEVVSRSIAELMLESRPEAERTRMSQFFANVMGGKSIEAELFEVKRKDGSAAFIDFNASPILDGRRVVGIQAVIRDVTERKKTEDRLYFQASLLDKVGNCVIVIDLADKITHWNKQSEELYGWKKEEVIDRGAKGILAEIGLNAFADVESKNLPQSGPWKGEAEVKRRDGVRFPARVTVTAIEDQSGRVIGYAYVSVNISERKQNEKRLSESEAKFRAIAEGSLDAIFTLDHRGYYTYVSPAIQRISGHAPKELIGTPIGGHLPSSALPKFTKAIKEVLLGGTIGAFEIEARRKDGSSFFAEVGASPVLDDKNSVTAIQGVIRDVTERTQAEETRRLLASIVESSPFGIISLGLDVTIASWNPAAERIFGYSAEEIIGRPASVFVPRDDPGAQAKFAERFKKLTESQGAVHFEGKWARKDGSLFDFSLEAFSISDVSGKITGFSGIINDITEQKAAEEEVRGLQETRARFVSAATHELKTPLVSIKGYSDLAASGSLGKLPEPLEHGLEVIGRNTNRMLLLIKELLEVERLNSGHLELAREVVDLNEVIRDSVENLRPLIISKKLEMDVVVPIGAHQVIGERIRLLQVIDNLLVNAVKFTPEKGKIRVLLMEDAGQIRVAVSDSGIGISPKNLAQLFEPFSKIPKSASGENQEMHGLYSTGLGLSVTKQLIGLHGGRIWAESQGEGKGSTFTFSVPRAPQ